MTSLFLSLCICALGTQVAHTLEPKEPFLVERLHKAESNVVHKARALTLAFNSLSADQLYGLSETRQLLIRKHYFLLFRDLQGIGIGQRPHIYVTHPNDKRFIISQEEHPPNETLLPTVGYGLIILLFFNQRLPTEVR